jgi:hypothetical protein
MTVVTAPAQWDARGRGLFLAGGITGCPDWQAQVIAALHDQDVTLLNPRRPHFPIGDPTAAEEQIRWEYDHFRLADAALFWFPAESICAIALFELGAWLAGGHLRGARLFLATHPDYPRRQDVLIQTRLRDPAVVVGDSLAGLVGDVRAWLAAPTGHATAGGGSG